MPVVSIRGRSLYYEWRGEAPTGSPTIVFLHDGLGAVGAWKDVPEHVANGLGARALVFDRWGYGQSDPRADFPFHFMEGEVEPFRELLRALDIERPFLVGHSDGGSIALLMAARHPQSVQAVVTEAAHVIVERETQAGIEALVALRRQGKTPGWLKRLHGDRADVLLDAWATSWLSADHARWDITSRLPAIRCPLLAIQGDRDEFGTPRQVELIVQGVPGAESWLVPGSGHTPHTAAQIDFERRVIEFLGRHGARSKSPHRLNHT
jgi:pimeloyl-ACP methyl ester carboxylesterase